MKNRVFAKGYVMGMVMTLLLTMLVPSFAAAITQRIDVIIGGLKIYVDGELIQPTDANGKPVEPIRYNGTTYLPVRALNQALTKGTKSIEWDNAAQSIYIGNRKEATVIPIDSLTTYDGVLYKKDFINNNNKTYSFSVRQTQYTPFNYAANNSFFGANYGHYLLKGSYTKVRGLVAMSDDTKAPLQSGRMRLFSYDSTSKQSKQLYETTIEYLVAPKSFEVSVAGVDQIYFVLDGVGYDTGRPHIFNVELLAE